MLTPILALAIAVVTLMLILVRPRRLPEPLLVLAGAPMSLAAFVRWLWLPSIASALITLVGLLALTWTTVDRRFARPFAEAIDRRAWLGGLGLAVLAVGYVLSDWLGVPLGMIAWAGAGLLLVLDAWSVRPSAATVVHDVSWGLLVLLAGLTVVEGLVRSGVTGC